MCSKSRIHKAHTNAHPPAGAHIQFVTPKTDLKPENGREPVQALPLVWFMVLVIAGSFCMLNLTVATVGQTFTKVKKEAEAKRAVQGHALMRRGVQECEGARVRGKRGK